MTRQIRLFVVGLVNRFFLLSRPYKCKGKTLTVRHLNHLDVRFTPRNLQFCTRFYVFKTCFFLNSLFLHSKSKENEDANSERALPEQRCHNRRPTDFVKPTHKLGSTKLPVRDPPKNIEFLYFSSQRTTRIGMLSMRRASDSWWGGPNLTIPLYGFYILTCPHTHRIVMQSIRGASDSWRGGPHLSVPWWCFLCWDMCTYTSCSSAEHERGFGLLLERA